MKPITTLSAIRNDNVIEFTDHNSAKKSAQHGGEWSMVKSNTITFSDDDGTFKSALSLDGTNDLDDDVSIEVFLSVRLSMLDLLRSHLLRYTYIYIYKPFIIFIKQTMKTSRT